MAFHVPDDAGVVEAIRRVLRSTKTIVSQREFGVHVQRELRRGDPDAHVGANRVRRLAAVQSFVRLEMRARKGPKEKVLNRCPVCGADLRRLKNQTLFGGEVTLTLRCPRCSYWTGKEKRIPTLYMFHYQGPRETVPEAPSPDKPF